MLLRQSVAVEAGGRPSTAALSGRLRICCGRGRSGNLGLLSDRLRDRERSDWMAAVELRAGGLYALDDVFRGFQRLGGASRRACLVFRKMVLRAMRFGGRYRGG